MLKASIAFFAVGIIGFFLGTYDMAGLNAQAGKILLIGFSCLALIGVFFATYTMKRPQR